MDIDITTLTQFLMRVFTKSVEDEFSVTFMRFAFDVPGVLLIQHFLVSPDAS